MKAAQSKRLQLLIVLLTLKKRLRSTRFSSIEYKRLNANNSELHFVQSDDDRSRKSRSNAIVVKPVTKKENSSGPHSSGHKNSFEQLPTKKKSSNSVNDKSPIKSTNKKSRKEIWMDKCGARALMDSNPGYYQSLKDNFLDYPNPIYQQIELDLKRTFPNNKNHATPEKEMQMRNILYSYAKRNPTIGYCQGLNFITAMLLQHLNEEEAFWVLCQVIEYMLPLDYYTTMTGVIIDQRSLELLIKSKFASVSRHLSVVEFDCQAIIFQWFVCLFANTLPFEIVANIWDHFFTRGIVAIFEHALAIFELMKKHILAAKDYGVLFELFRTFPMTITNWKKLSTVAKKHKTTWDIIKLKRSILAQEVYQEYEEQHREKASHFKRKNSAGTVKVEFLSKFNQLMKLKGFEEMDNPTFDSCMEDLVNSNKTYRNGANSRIKEHFAFRCSSIPIVDDYFGDGSGEFIQAKTNSELSFQNTNLHFDDLLIERNSQMSEIATLETKFKALPDQRIDDFFHNLIPPSLGESTKSAI